MTGKREWLFPDGELPPMGDNPELYGHESIVITNPGDKEAEVEITLYWTDRDPTGGEKVRVGAKRVLCVHITEKEGFFGHPVTVGEQYAIALKSTEPVVAQYGRLDMRTGVMAFYTTPGYCE